MYSFSTFYLTVIPYFAYGVHYSICDAFTLLLTQLLFDTHATNVESLPTVLLSKSLTKTEGKRGFDEPCSDHALESFVIDSDESYTGTTYTGFQVAIVVNSGIEIQTLRSRLLSQKASRN